MTVWRRRSRRRRRKAPPRGRPTTLRRRWRRLVPRALPSQQPFERHGPPDGQLMIVQPLPGAHDTTSIPACLQAEALLGVDSTTPASNGAPPWAWEQRGECHLAGWQQQVSHHHQQQWGGGPGGSLGSSDTAATDAGAAAQRRPPSASSLGETALALRLTVHEKQMELLQLRALHAALTVRAGWQSCSAWPQLLATLLPVAGCHRLAGLTRYSLPRDCKPAVRPTQPACYCSGSPYTAQPPAGAEPASSAGG